MSAEPKALAVVTSDKITVTSEQMNLARQTVAKDLDDNQFALYCYNCQRLGVHPLDGLLIPIVRNDTERNEKRLTFVNTVDLLRSRAAETGDYAGSDDAKFDYMGKESDFPSDAHVTVWKFVQGEKCSFSATARWEEYYPGEKQGFMWRGKPHVMLAKCAEALALRKAFPKQLAGLYIPEELQKEIESKTSKSRQQQKATAKPVGDVMCAECRAINGHLPSCSHRQKDGPQPTQTQEPEKKPELLKWLVQVEAVDARTKSTKDQAGKTVSRSYRMLTCINQANENITLYAWDTKLFDRLDWIKPKTACIFIVKPQSSGDKTYYNVDSIVEITGEPKPPQEDMFPDDAS
jgi:phage recombination protein Bet